MREMMKKFKTVRILMALAVVFVMSLAMGSQSKAAGPLAQVTGLRQIDADEDSIDLKWNALYHDDVEYEVWLSTDKRNWWLVEDETDDNEADIDERINAGRTYYVRVRAYMENDWGPKTYGAFSSILEVVTAPRSERFIVRHTNSTGSSISLSWRSVRGANRYRVEYRRAGADWYSPRRAVYVKGTSTTLKKLSANGKYNIWVYPVRQTSNGRVKAIGDDAGYRRNVSVAPGKAGGLTCSYYWDNLGEIKMECNEKEGADGYQWELYTSYKSRNKKLKTVYSRDDSVYIKHSYLKKHNFYKVRVRAYCENDNGKKCYGSWSNWDYISQQPDVKLRNTRSGIKASWDKIAGADRYVVYVSTKRNSGYRKFCTTRGTSKTITRYGSSRLKSNRTYYVYVVAQNKSGRTYYSGEAEYCWKIKYRK